MWANEGLAEYFGEGLFTGDGFEMGLVPLVRLARVRKLVAAATVEEGGAMPLAVFVAIDRETWNKSIELRNYDQAWSIVHFLVHAENGRYQKIFDTFVTEVGKGGDSAKVYAKTLGAVPELEKKWRAWWAGQGDSPTAEGYARATVGILASFAARASVSGQSFASADELIRTEAAKLKMPAAQWLPATLFEAGVNQAMKMRSRGDLLVLGKSQEGSPVVQLTMKGGTKIVGRAIVKGGRVEGMEVKVVERGK